MKRISVAEKPPRDGQYVLVKVLKDNWGDDKDAYFRVARFRKGLSLVEREALPETNRKEWEKKYSYGYADEGSNNEKPYCWDSAPSVYFGQEVEHYWELPK